MRLLHKPRRKPQASPDAKAWLPAEDRELSLGAGRVPFLVLQRNIAAQGQLRTRFEIRQRFNLLRDAGLIRRSRRLSLTELAPEVVKRIMRHRKRLQAGADPAVLLGAGYSRNMLQRALPEAFEAPIEGRAPGARYRGIPVFTYPTTKAEIREAMKECGITTEQLASALGMPLGAVMAVLRPHESLSRTGRGEARRIRQVLGLIPPGGVQALALTYPTTIAQVRKAMAQAQVGITELADHYQVGRSVLASALRHPYARVRCPPTKLDRLRQRLGLVPPTELATLVFSYPTTRAEVLAVLKGAGISTTRFAQLHGLKGSILRDELNHPGRAAPEGTEAMRARRILGFAPVEDEGEVSVASQAILALAASYPNSTSRISRDLGRQQLTVDDASKALGLRPEVVRAVMQDKAMAWPGVSSAYAQFMGLEPDAPDRRSALQYSARTIHLKLRLAQAGLTLEKWAQRNGFDFEEVAYCVTLKRRPRRQAAKRIWRALGLERNDQS